MHPASAALPAPNSHPGVARTFDAIVLTLLGRGFTPLLVRPRSAGSLGDCAADAGCSTCILNVNGSLPPLFVKVQGNLWLRSELDEDTVDRVEVITFKLISQLPKK